MRNSQSLLLFACLIFGFVVFFRIFGYFKIRPTLSTLKKMHSRGRDQRAVHRNFEQVHLQFKEAKTFDQWWEALCQAAGEMGFSGVTMDVERRDGTLSRLKWRDRTGIHLPQEELMTAAIPVKQRRPYKPMVANVEASIHGGLELVGRRLTLFGRLLDEWSVADLPLEEKGGESILYRSEKIPPKFAGRLTSQGEKLEVSA